MKRKKGICAPEIRTERQAPCRSPKKKLGPITVRNSLNTMQNADSACKTELDESKTYSIGAGLRNQRPGVRIAPGALFISLLPIACAGAIGRGFVLSKGTYRSPIAGARQQPIMRSQQTGAEVIRFELSHFCRIRSFVDGC